MIDNFESNETNNQEDQINDQQMQSNEPSTNEVEPKKRGRKKRTHEDMVSEALARPNVKAEYDALEEEFNKVEENITEKKLVRATIKRDCSFQMGMPSRADIYVTINLRVGDVVTDPSILSALLNTDAKFDPVYE